MTAEYPWYTVVEGEELQQGDLIRSFPILVPLVEIASTTDAPVIEADIQKFNVLVMTQSCDLEQEKIDKIVLCAHSDLAVAQAEDEGLKGKDVPKNMQKGKYPRYQLLAASATAVLMPLQVLDFGQIYSMPKELVIRIAKEQGQRLRLLPPYREHIAQAFARFYMRVALPVQPLDVTVPPSSQASP